MWSATVRLCRRPTNNALVDFVPSRLEAMPANSGEALPARAAIIIPLLPSESGGIMLTVDSYRLGRRKAIAVPTTSAQRRALYSSLRLSHNWCRRSNHSDFGAWASSVGPFAGKSSSLSDSTSWIAVFCLKLSTRPLEIPLFAAYGRTNFCQSSSDPAHRKY